MTMYIEVLTSFHNIVPPLSWEGSTVSNLTSIKTIHVFSSLQWGRGLRVLNGGEKKPSAFLDHSFNFREREILLVASCRITNQQRWDNTRGKSIFKLIPIFRFEIRTKNCNTTNFYVSNVQWRQLSSRTLYCLWILIYNSSTFFSKMSD
jgi:hypothetical protein